MTIPQSIIEIKTALHIASNKIGPECSSTSANTKLSSHCDRSTTLYAEVTMREPANKLRLLSFQKNKTRRELTDRKVRGSNPTLGTSVSRPSCFFRVTWQLGTERMLQLNHSIHSISLDYPFCYFANCMHQADLTTVDILFNSTTEHSFQVF
ncbi:hypothetical protein CSKR_111869 [Clonorchis sinensis]|uniref:Uncharacterized protein n=1 Tax=Clonorchis sinensis TaxID=79923 RepID=A0A3R7EV90_CLOSI|nr:hypothetical protein CSKR_111869 [Clonorchis sinensis]